MLSTKIICVLLMSCFEKELTNFDKCPRNCKCFSAPKDGDNWSEESKSLICDDIQDLSYIQLKQLEPINTLKVGIQSNSRKDLTRDSSTTPLYINNLYLCGKQTESIAKINSSSQLVGIDVKALKVLTLIDLDLNTFDWKFLLPFKELEAIHIENCILDKLDQNTFGLLRALKIISVSIIKSNLKDIDKNAFNEWIELKMISIVGNPLNEMTWLEVNLPKLWYLNLQNNYIKQLTDNFDNKLPRLKVLQLDRNNLKQLSWQQISHLLPTLREFSLDDNILCMSNNVKILYQKLFNYWKSNRVPAFFYNSMVKMVLCRESGAPTFLCSNRYNDDFLKDEIAFQSCLNSNKNVYK